MTQNPPIVTIRHSEGRSEMIKAVWNQAVQDEVVDWAADPVLEVWMPLYGVFTYEKIIYDAARVVECDGVVVHIYPKRERLGATFDAYCHARDTYDRLCRENDGQAYRAKIGVAIEQMEERNPDFRQAYEEIRRDMPPL